MSPPSDLNRHNSNRFGTIFPALDCRHLKIPNCLKCMLILLKLSVHLNQKYPSVPKYYEKKQFVDIFCKKMALKKGPFSIAQVHSFFAADLQQLFSLLENCWTCLHIFASRGKLLVNLFYFARILPDTQFLPVVQ